MARRYEVLVYWQEKGNRYERVATVSTVASSARNAVNNAMKWSKSEAGKGSWRECEGAVFKAQVVVGPTVKKN